MHVSPYMKEVRRPSLFQYSIPPSWTPHFETLMRQLLTVNICIVNFFDKSSSVAMPLQEERDTKTETETDVIIDNAKETEKAEDGRIEEDTEARLRERI